MTRRSRAPERVVVILGMHRSGTSLLARGVAALGLTLGDRLLPARVPDNPTGYWEDADFVAFDDELLRAIECSWSRPGIDPDALESLARDATWLRRGASLVTERLDGNGAFAVKDPRISRLLRFWRPVFRQCGVDASFVFSVRNPLEIARSLSRRDPPIEPATAYALTAEHLFVPLLELRGESILVVNYEVFLQKPRHVLRRLAGYLGVDPKMATGPEADAFCTSFVLPEGRRERAAPNEFESDALAPTALKRLSGTLAAAHGRNYQIPANADTRAPFTAWEGISYGLRHGAGAEELRMTREHFHNLERKLEELQAQGGLTAQHVANLQQSLAASEAAADHARRQELDLRRRVGELETERSLSIDHVRNLENARATSDAALEHTRRHCSELVRRADEREKERSLTADHAANLEQARAASDAALEHMRLQCRALEKRIGELETERTLTNGHVLNLERLGASSRQTVQEMTDRVSELEQRGAALEAARAQSDGRNAELEQALRARDAEIAQAAVKAQALAGEIARLRAELERFWWLPRRRALRTDANV